MGPNETIRAGAANEKASGEELKISIARASTQCRQRAGKRIADLLWHIDDRRIRWRTVRSQTKVSRIVADESSDQG
jgi:hypothetical protein